jgi:hypothetical protein
VPTAPDCSLNNSGSADETLVTSGADEAPFYVLRSLGSRIIDGEDCGRRLFHQKNERKEQDE